MVMVVDGRMTVEGKKGGCHGFKGALDGPKLGLAGSLNDESRHIAASRQRWKRTVLLARSLASKISGQPTSGCQAQIVPDPKSSPAGANPYHRGFQPAQLVLATKDGGRDWPPSRPPASTTPGQHSFQPAFWPAQLPASTASGHQGGYPEIVPWWHEFWPTRSLATTVSGQRSFQPAQLPATKADIHGFRPAQRPDDMQNRPLVARILSSAVSCRQG
ncbi:hypothetical protein VDGL01_12315 [Verticillium dahliae]